MRVRRLKHRVTIQERADSRDAAGGNIPTWADYAERWAAVEPLRGTEQFTAQQVKDTTWVRVIFRWDSMLAGVNPPMRIVDQGSRILEIESVIDLGSDHRQIEALCTYTGKPV